jgi:hypothetical protein
MRCPFYAKIGDILPGDVAIGSSLLPASPAPLRFWRLVLPPHLGAESKKQIEATIRGAVSCSLTANFGTSGQSVLIDGDPTLRAGFAFFIINQIQEGVTANHAGLAK